MTRTRAQRPGRAVTAVLTITLVLAGFALMFYPRLTDIRYEYAQWRLGGDVAVAADGSSAEALPDDAVAHIRIPAIGLAAYVVEGTDDGSLANGPGHYPDTPLPGEPGNAGIAGHRTMYGSVFHDLHELSSGDRIHVLTDARRISYVVTEVKVVDPSQVDVVAPATDTRLTLTTCHPIGSAAQRLVVVAVAED